MIRMNFYCLFKTALFAVFCLQLSQVTSAEVFRCVNSEGKTGFQDFPCDATEKQQSYQLPEVQNTLSSNVVSVNNLVKNHGFEEGLKHWSIEPVPWNSNGIQLREKLELYPSAVVEFAATLNQPPKPKRIYRVLLHQCVLLGRGEEFALSAKVRVDKIPEKSFANRLNIVWYESEDCSKGGQFGSWIDLKKKTGWQTIEQKKLKPSIAAKAAKIEIAQNAEYAEGIAAYWDNISLEITKRSPLFDNKKTAGKTLATGKNYLKNPSFAKDLSDWKISIFSKQWVNDYQHRGALKTTINSNKGSMGRGVFSQCVNFGKNKKFDMGIRFKRDSRNTNKGGGRLRTTWHSSADCSGKYKGRYHVEPKAGVGWQMLTVKGMEAPEDTVSVEFEVIQSIEGAGSFSVYWDEAYFYRSAY